jgi:basic membrane protein A and related proteins
MTMNSYRRQVLIGAVVILTLILAACAAPAAPTEAPAVDEPVAEEHGMALLLGGIKDDSSWAEAGFDSLQRIGDTGLRIAYSESVAAADAPRVMREYIEQGYDMIVGHTILFQDAVFEVAAEHPDVNFAWSGGVQGTGTNVADYDQPFHEGAYLVGILAGYMSESGSIGALSGFDIPVCHSMGEAFFEGAKTVNPDIAYVHTAVGHFQDISKAKEAALAQHDTAGVDFWMTCGPGPALGSIEAAKEVGGYTTGYVSDMSALGPNEILSSIVWDLYPIFENIYADTLAGSFDNPWYQFGIDDDAIDVVINPALLDLVPEDALTAVDDAISQIKDGSLVVPYVPVAE